MNQHAHAVVSVLVAVTLATTAFGEGTNTAKTITPPDDIFAHQAATLQKRGLGFDQIFAELCKTALADVDKDPKLRLDDYIRSVFGGLWLWTRKGGTPVLQARNDWALHFIGGGAFEGYWDIGRAAAVTKEKMDSNDPNNFYDLDDMAATMLGARWMDIAVNTDDAVGRHWIELWASGQYTISRSLPKLEFGHLPPGQRATPEEIRKVRDVIEAALKPPDERAK
jgi:hypothetical protein